MRISDWSSDVCSSDLHEFTEIANHFDEMAEEIKFREEQWETAIRRQTKQNAILRRAVQDQSLDETLTALAEFAQEQVTGTLATVAMPHRDPNRNPRCIKPKLPPPPNNPLTGMKIG